MTPDDISRLLTAQAEFAAVYHAGGKALVKFRLMADQKDAAFVCLQGTGQLLLGVHIQMVSRLIQKQNIGLAVEQFT